MPISNPCLFKRRGTYSASSGRSIPGKGQKLFHNREYTWPGAPLGPEMLGTTWIALRDALSQWQAAGWQAIQLWCSVRCL